MSNNPSYADLTTPKIKIMNDKKLRRERSDLSIDVPKNGDGTREHSRKEILLEVNKPGSIIDELPMSQEASPSGRLQSLPAKGPINEFPKIKPQPVRRESDNMRIKTRLEQLELERAVIERKVLHIAETRRKKEDEIAKWKDQFAQQLQLENMRSWPKTEEQHAIEGYNASPGTAVTHDKEHHQDVAQPAQQGHEGHEGHPDEMYQHPITAPPVALHTHDLAKENARLKHELAKLRDTLNDKNHMILGLMKTVEETNKLRGEEMKAHEAVWTKSQKLQREIDKLLEEQRNHSHLSSSGIGFSLANIGTNRLQVSAGNHSEQLARSGLQNSSLPAIGGMNKKKAIWREEASEKFGLPPAPAKSTRSVKTRMESNRKIPIQQQLYLAHQQGDNHLPKLALIPPAQGSSHGDPSSRQDASLPKQDSLSKQRKLAPEIDGYKLWLSDTKNMEFLSDAKSKKQEKKERIRQRAAHR